MKKVEDIDLTRATWRKASASNQSGSCVEVADNVSGVVAVRDSKNPTGGVLIAEPAEWSQFILAANAGKFDI